MSAPDFHSFLKIDRESSVGEIVEKTRKRVSEIRENSRADWFRATVVDDCVWIEGWLVRPEIEPPFDPSMVPA